MPNRDGTGPEGKGPKTGRQMGNCGNGGGRRTCCGRVKGSGKGFSAKNVKNTDNEN